MSLLIFRFWTVTVFTSLKNGLMLLKDKALEIMLKYGRTEAQSQPQGSGKNNNTLKALQLTLALILQNVVCGVIKFVFNL